jgi:hypothetical protein
MARVTRSKKIEIAEDNTALAIQTPLPQTLAKKPLAELPKETNKMPSMEDSVDAELKGLKAAYRTAIGGKKGKKSKSKKKAKQLVQETSQTDDTSTQPIIDDGDNLSAVQTTNKGGEVVVDEEEILSVKALVNDPAFASESNRQCSEGSLGSLNRRLSTLTIHDLTEVLEATEQYKRPVGRTTRQHIAQTEAGQSDLSLKASRPANTQHHLGYLLSLWGRRAVPASRPTSTTQQLQKLLLTTYY